MKAVAEVLGDAAWLDRGAPGDGRDGDGAGYFEIDLVAYCGSTLKGEHAWVPQTVRRIGERNIPDKMTPMTRLSVDHGGADGHRELGPG